MWNGPTSLGVDQRGFSGTLRDRSLEAASVQGMRRAGLVTGQPPHLSHKTTQNTTAVKTPIVAGIREHGAKASLAWGSDKHVPAHLAELPHPGSWWQ